MMTAFLFIAVTVLVLYGLIRSTEKTFIYHRLPTRIDDRPSVVQRCRAKTAP